MGAPPQAGALPALRGLLLGESEGRPGARLQEAPPASTLKAGSGEGSSLEEKKKKEKKKKRGEKGKAQEPQEGQVRKPEQEESRKRKSSGGKEKKQKEQAEEDPLFQVGGSSGVKEEEESSDKERTFGEELTDVVEESRRKGKSSKEEVHCPKEDCELKKGGAGVSSEEENVELESEKIGALGVTQESRGAEAVRGEGAREERRTGDSRSPSSGRPGSYI